MRKTLAIGLVTALVAVSYFGLLRPGTSEAGKKGAPMLSHDVYFALKDNSAKAKQELVDACKKYLSKHPGEVFFAVGTLAEDYKREVNDRDFDVALHIVFSDGAAQEKYQVAERHKQFIEEQKGNWKKVRVFDSLVTQ
jgi:Stress responsive A/B Barrel Domain